MTSLFKKIRSLMALCLFLVLQVSPVEAADNHHILHLQLEHYQTVLEKLGDKTEGQTLQVWKLGEGYTYDNREQIVNDLHSWDLEALNKAFPTSSYPMAFKADHIEVANIPSGLYYVRRIIDTDTLIYQSEFLFAFDDKTTEPVVILAKKTETPTTQVKLIKKDQDGNLLKGVGFRLVKIADDGSQQAVPLVGQYRYQAGGTGTDITLYTDDKGEINVTNLPLGNYQFIEVEPLAGYKVLTKETNFTIKDSQLVTVTVINNKPEEGKFEFIKQDDSTKRPLKGAVFKVTQLIDGQYQTVIQNGKELILTSGENGRFTAENLPYGTYYIWEIKAPSGYVQLTAPLTFEVDGGLSEKKVLVINNHKRPPIDVPNTGNATLYVLIMIAILLFVGGYVLTKQDRKY